jgi:hypothetical protein
MIGGSTPASRARSDLDLPCPCRDRRPSSRRLKEKTAGGPRRNGKTAQPRGRHRRSPTSPSRTPPAMAPPPLPGRRTSSERRRPWTRRPSSLSIVKEPRGDRTAFPLQSDGHERPVSRGDPRLAFSFVSLHSTGSLRSAWRSCLWLWGCFFDQKERILYFLSSWEDSGMNGAAANLLHRNVTSLCRKVDSFTAKSTPPAQSRLLWRKVDSFAATSPHFAAKSAPSLQSQLPQRKVDSFTAKSTPSLQSQLLQRKVDSFAAKSPHFAAKSTPPPQRNLTSRRRTNLASRWGGV